MKTLSQAEQQQEIDGRLMQLSPDHTARWGRMNAGAMLQHLLESFEVALGERPVQPRRSILRSPAGRWLALRAPVTWAKNFPTVPELDILRRGAPTGDFHFDAARSTLITHIDRFCSCPGEHLLAEHPLFGIMSRDEWMRWGYLHTDHHLRQFGC
jgi:hypothetical protein